MLTFKQFSESWLDQSYGHDLNASGPSSGYVTVTKQGDSENGKQARIVRRMGAQCGVEFWENGKPVTSKGMRWYHAAELKPVVPGKKFGRTRTPAGDLR